MVLTYFIWCYDFQSEMIFAYVNIVSWSAVMSYGHANLPISVSTTPIADNTNNWAG